MANLSESAIKAILEGKNAGKAGELAKEIHAILSSSAAKTAAHDAADEDQYKRMTKALKELNAEELSRTEIAQLQATLDTEHISIEEKLLKAMQEQLEIELLSNDALATSVQETVKKINQQKEYIKTLARSKKMEEQVASATERVGEGLKEAMGYSEDFGESMLGSMLDMSASGATATQMMDGLIKSMDIQPIHMVENAIEKTGEALLFLGKSMLDQMMALDAQQAAFRKSTGLGKEYDQMMKDTYEANKLNGVSLDENGKAWADLAAGMSDFTMLGSESKALLASTAGILQENGVATETFSANTQVMNKALGMGAADAAQFNTSMVAMAKDIGMAPQQLAEGFGEVAGTLSALSGGSEAASTAMRGLSATSKATGIAIGRIVDITSQFDTFEGASESVGKLNAMLGGDFVNAMDVMAAEDPAERFGMMQQALDDAGKSFDDMAYYEKKAIAESMGLKDTNELAMLMSGNMDDLAGDFGKTSDEIEEMAKQAKANQSVQESFQQLMSQMAPTFQFLIDGARGFVEMLQKLGPVLPFATIGLTVLGVALIALRQALMLNALLKQTAIGMQFLGSAGFKAGMKIMLGFAIFVLLAALIYGVYKWLGPLAGGFTLLALGAVALGIAIATGLTTATGGLYLIIPGVILVITGLIGIFVGLYKWVKKLSTGAKVLGLILMMVFSPLVVMIVKLWLLYKIIKFVVTSIWNSAAAMTGLKIALAIMFAPLLLVVGAFYGLYKIIKFVSTSVWEGVKSMTGLKVALAIVFAPILLIVGALKGLYKIGKSIIAWMQKTGAAAGALKAVLAVAFAPLLIVIAALKGLVAVGAKVIDFFKGVGEKAKKYLGAPFRLAAAGVAAVKDKLAAVGSAVKGAALAPFKAMGNMMSKVAGGFSKLGGKMKSFASDKINALKESLKSIPDVFGKMKDKMSELGKKFPMLGKAAKLLGAPFRALQKGFSAVTGAYSAGGLMGVAKMAGGAIGNMLGFQAGGTTPGGPIIVGESGPEIVAPPAGAGILPNFLTEALAHVGGTVGGMLGMGGGGGGGQEINLNVTLELDGRELGNYIKKVTLPMMNPVSGGG
tara:strand:+ start:1903 stop:5118 length:3216 start_codon:yes stop_codon:yes gene_type:complete